jgi:hypothetical protein
MRILPARSRAANATTVAVRAAVLLAAGRVLRAEIGIAGRVAMIAAAAHVLRGVAESRLDSAGRAGSEMIAAVAISAISVRPNRRRRACLS